MLIRKGAVTAKRPGGGAGGGVQGVTASKGRQIPTLEEFIAGGDFTGAITLLEFRRRTGEADEKTLPWLGYCAFHLGDYHKALEVYEEMLAAGPSCPPEVLLYKSACLYYLQDYVEAEKAALAGPASLLQNRLMFHICHKLGRESDLLKHHARLSEAKADQLSLAAMHAQRSHFNDAVDIYKRLLLENRSDIALNVYIAMCYYKLDYYEEAQEILGMYLQARPTSLIALNLKACNVFKIFNGRTAEAEFKALADQGINLEASDLMRHNLCVFRGGEGALRVLPSLVDAIPEARLNLVIYHLRSGAMLEAYELMKGVEPAVANEYILKGIVHAVLGQRRGTEGGAGAGSATGIATAVAGGPNAISNREHLRLAQQYFHVVGNSPSECDTIPGRQAMASCFYLRKEFEDVNVYLSSVKAYMASDDDFLWNYGISLAATGDYKQAEEMLSQVQSAAYAADVTYLSWLARCYCMNEKARHAWEVYLRMDSGSDALQVLRVIAVDSYRTGQFLIAAKAYDVLHRLDPDPEFWDGLRGAAAGVLQAVIAGRESRDGLREVLVILRSQNNPQAEFISRVITRWAQANGGL